MTPNVSTTESLLKTGALLQKAILSSANFSSIATDARGVIQVFNTGAERMLGYSADEVTNKITPADISDPEEMSLRARALSREFGTAIAAGFEALVFKASRGIEDIYELTYIRKDESRFPAVVSITALRDADEAIIGYLLIGTDGTARQQLKEERSRLDQKLRDQQFYTRSLIESNIDALVTTDPFGIITDVNKQTEALTDCTRDELIGAPFKNYFSEPMLVEAAITQTLAEGKVSNQELTAKSRDGKLTVVSCNATTFHDRNRILQGVFVSARDVTEVKQFEQALQQKNAELENASLAKSEFLANMSHELRTPLNAIIGFSEVLKEGLLGNLTERQTGCMNDIYESGTLLLSLINDILDLSRVESGLMDLELDSVSVSSLLSNSLSVVKGKADARKIALEMTISEELESVRVDVSKVKQIVYNLLSNAVKFAVVQGEVGLAVRRTSRAEVGVLTGARPGRSFPLEGDDFEEFLEISVSDNGIGITPEGMERLFNPFIQIDGGLERRFEGTGLGLAMVRKLATLHGGAIAVESALGEGSTFKVWLPSRRGEETPIPIVEEVPTVPFEIEVGDRVAMVIEDDPNSAELLGVHLSDQGFKVIYASSAETALEIARKWPLSLITLDLLLPGMDGWEFLDEIKSIQGARHIPVVIVSAVGAQERGAALGAAAVLEKPLSRQDFCGCLGNLGLLPLPAGKSLKVLVVDDDPKAVELIALRALGLDSTVFRAYNGRQAVDIARAELPDLIVLDLMMPRINGFDVVEALDERPETAHIPILVVTAKRITAEDRVRLGRYSTTIMEKSEFHGQRFLSEVRRATSRSMRSAAAAPRR